MQNLYCIFFFNVKRWPFLTNINGKSKEFPTSNVDRSGKSPHKCGTVHADQPWYQFFSSFWFLVDGWKHVIASSKYVMCEELHFKLWFVGVCIFPLVDLNQHYNKSIFFHIQHYNEYILIISIIAKRNQFVLKLVRRVI